MRKGNFNTNKHLPSLLGPMWEGGKSQKPGGKVSSTEGFLKCHLEMTSHMPNLDVTFSTRSRNFPNLSGLYHSKNIIEDVMSYPLKLHLPRHHPPNLLRFACTGLASRVASSALVPGRRLQRMGTEEIGVTPT